MSTLSRGRYTYGNKTWAQIIAITGANIGDTVWDTTYNKRRSWDGNNFVHSNQKSLTTTSTLINGMVAVVSSTQNSQIESQTGTVDTEGTIGIVEDSRGGAIAATASVTYHGDVKALITLGSTINPGNYLRNSTTVVGYCSNTATVTGVGTFGVYIDAATSTTGLYRILFKPVERN